MAVTGLCGLTLAACIQGGDYRRPPVPVPETWAALAGDEGVPEEAVRTDRLPEAGWWRGFHNEELTGLIERALENNHDVRAAVARVVESRAGVMAAGAGLYPQANLTSAYSRIRRSETILVAPTDASPEGFAGPGAEFDIWNAALDLRWELDLWGRIRRSREAAAADARAAEEDLRAVRLSLIGDVGQAYFRLRELDEQIELTEQNIAAQREALDIIRSRADAGLASDLDVKRAETLVAETAATLPEFVRLRRAERHRLEVLVGVTPGSLTLPRRPLRLVVVQPEIPAGLPAQLLERRPDILEVERRLMAANARIGEARAHFFPSFSLTGQAGLQSSEFARWFQAASRTVTVGPAVTLPIFLGGTNVARLDTAQARYEALLAEYHQTILAAFREVADLLVSVRARTEQRDRQREQVRAARDAEVLAALRYRKGLVNFLDVIDAHRTVLRAEGDFVETERARLVDLVLLYKAVGGGWEDPTMVQGAESEGGRETNSDVKGTGRVSTGSGEAGARTTRPLRGLAQGTRETEETR